MTIETSRALKRRRQQQKILRGKGSFKQRLTRAINLIPVTERYYA